MKPSIFIVYIVALAIVVAGETRIRGKVRKRYMPRRHRAVLPPCNFNETIIEDEWTLMEAIGKSKYIFTGKVLNVKKSRPSEGLRAKRSNVYKVYMRRVLKGDANELKGYVKLEDSSDSLSGAMVIVEKPRARESCAPGPRPRLSAIFLSDGVYIDVVRPIPKLRLLTDPVPLTLYHLDRINAAVKG